MDKPSDRDRLSDHAIVAAITRDSARVWLLNGVGPEPVTRVVRATEALHRHVRPAQPHHLHADETSEAGYFDELEVILGEASTVVLVGHGKGKANEVDRFMGHLASTRSPLLSRIVGTGVANLPAMTDGEIIAAARERWSAGYL